MVGVRELRSHRLAQGIWLVVAVISASLFFGSRVSQWRSITTACRRNLACSPSQLNPASLHALHQHGISIETYAVFTLVVWLLVALSFYCVAALIVWHKPDDRGAMISAYFLTIFPMTALAKGISQGLVNDLLQGIFIVAALIFALVFPDGRFAARWTAGLAVLIVAFFVWTFLPTPGPPDAIGTAMFVGAFVAVVGAIIYRYRVVSSPVQRAQTRWALLGLCVAAIALPLVQAPPAIFGFPGGSGSIYHGLHPSALTYATIPISIGVAMLRSGLWDIDRVVNRALVYATLTAILAGTYVGCVLGLQALFGLISRQSSSLAIAVSTLAIAALFGPLRRLIQKGIDRRFFRSKYDAQRTVAVFGERLRDQLDPNQLAWELEIAVSRTLQPAHVGIRLLDPAPQAPRDGSHTQPAVAAGSGT